jgi:hypothetical protein
MGGTSRQRGTPYLQPARKLPDHHHISISILPSIGSACAMSKKQSNLKCNAFEKMQLFLKSLYFKAALFLGYRPYATDNRQNGDRYVVIDGKIFRRIVLTVFHPADLVRSFLVSTFLALFVYLLFLPL